jgi:hypothetical protein
MENDIMTVIFSELNELSRDGRLELYQSGPQSLEDILLYYLSPICPPGRYGELAEVVRTIDDPLIRQKMESLLWNASNIRINDSYAFISGNVVPQNVVTVRTCEVQPPTDRLGGLYSDYKLENVLEGMETGTILPPVQLRALPGHGDFKYRVIDGIHRYYASVKRGYAELPAQLV